MCGVIGMLSPKVRAHLLDGLERLEYRGYDSAGVGLWRHDALWRVKAIGRIKALRACVDERQAKEGDCDSTCGIGQTRWATHGNVTLKNAHPHGTARVLIVQNGIVENMESLRKAFEAEGHVFESETDAELFPIAVEKALEDAEKKDNLSLENLPSVIQKALACFEGSFAVLFLIRDFKDVLVAYRQGHNPLAIGYKEGVKVVGSDVLSMGQLVEHVAYLEDGDLALLTPDEICVWQGAKKREVAYAAQPEMDDLLCRGDHPHFMHKEIFEQPKVAHKLLEHYTHHVHRLDVPKMPFSFNDLSYLRLSACGTAAYAAFLGAMFFEKWAKLPTFVDVASEFPLKVHAWPNGGAVGFISQSGETADTLAAMHYAKKANQHTFALLNNTQSAMGRLADCVLPLCAGPEMSVASTKAFMAQLLVLMFLALEAAKVRGTLIGEKRSEIIDALEQLPDVLASVLTFSHTLQEKAKNIIDAKTMLYLGRGPFFALALEGALKMKELSYIHAEGYAAGEIKHGPMALMEEGLPVLVLAPSGPYFLKTLANIQEVMSRGADVLILTNETGFVALSTAQQEKAIALPDVPDVLAPFVHTVAMQLLAYHTAALMGHDVDRPRNLAKSVTVV